MATPSLLQRLNPFARVSREERPTESRVVYGRTQAGVTVTPSNALTNAVVWGCVTYLGRTVGQLPWHVMTDRKGSKIILDKQHPTSYVLRVRPTPYMSPLSWRETMVGWALLWGNAVAEIQWDGRGIPQAMFPIHPDRITFDSDSTSDLVYRISNPSGVQSVLYPEDVFHLRGFGDGPVGLNVIAYAAQSIGWAKATELFGSAFFGQGTNPSGIVKTKGKLKPEGLEKLKDDFKQLYAGPRNAQKTLFLDGDMDWERISVDPQQAQFIETRQHQVPEICRWFGVPPHKVMDLLRATFSNIEHQSIEVVVDSIAPWVIRLEQECNAKLFGVGTSFYSKINLKGLLRGDFASRQAGLNIMRNAGALSVDEWREFEDMNPLPEGQGGDKYVMQSQYTLLEKVGEEPPQPVQAPAPAAQPAPEEREEESRRENARLVALVERLLDRPTQPAPIVYNEPAQVHVAAPDFTAIVNALANLPTPVVNVAAPNVTVEPALIDVAAPIVNVAAPNVTVEAPNVNVEQPHVTLEATMPAPEMFDVSILSQAVREGFMSVEPAVINIAPPAVNVAAPVVNVNVPELPAPQITVEIPADDADREQIVVRDKQGELEKVITRKVKEKGNGR